MGGRQGWQRDGRSIGSAFPEVPSAGEAPFRGAAPCSRAGVSARSRVQVVRASQRWAVSHGGSRAVGGVTQEHLGPGALGVHIRAW